MLDEKLSCGETYKENKSDFDTSSLYPPPYINTDRQFTSKMQGFQHPTVWSNEKKKAWSKTLYTVPFLVLFKTRKRLRQQHSPSELKPTGAEAALGQCSFHELWAKTGLIHRTCWAVRPQSSWAAAWEPFSGVGWALMASLTSRGRHGVCFWSSLLRSCLFALDSGWGRDGLYCQVRSLLSTVRLPSNLRFLSFMHVQGPGNNIECQSSGEIDTYSQNHKTAFSRPLLR